MLYTPALCYYYTSEAKAVCAFALIALILLLRNTLAACRLV